MYVHALIAHHPVLMVPLEHRAMETQLHHNLSLRLFTPIRSDFCLMCAARIAVPLEHRPMEAQLLYKQFSLPVSDFA